MLNYYLYYLKNGINSIIQKKAKGRYDYKTQYKVLNSSYGVQYNNTFNVDPSE